VTQRHIVAMGGGGFLMDDPVMDGYVLELVDAARPKVCFLPTASGNVASYVVRFLDAFPSRSFEPTYLDLFERTVADLEGFLREQDIVYVGGGNTANMLAIWRVHGVDVALRSAWEAGVVCCGISAGANCWFEASTTDSFLIGRADPLPDGLGLVSGSFCPHYDGEAARRPSFHGLIAAGDLPDGVGCDDFAAVHFADDEILAALSSRPGAGAYRVTRNGDRAVETALPVVVLEQDRGAPTVG
jgi:dipeptidase E